MTLFRSMDKVQGMLYLFGVQDFVPDEDDHVGKKERFKRVIIPLEKVFGLDMRWKQGCELNGFPGIDLEYLSKLGLTVRLRVYLVKHRFYILMAFASPRGLSSNALHFLSSLTITAENPKH